MDAVLFLKEYKRMCDIYTENLCNECPLKKTGNCNIVEGNPDFQKIVEITEQWSKEHPKKTRMQDFLEKFPNALLTGKNETPTACCKHLGYIKECVPGRSCVECWNQPVEE